jgi:hypothetical protein
MGRTPPPPSSPSPTTAGACATPGRPHSAPSSLPVAITSVEAAGWLHVWQMWWGVVDHCPSSNSSTGTWLQLVVPLPQQQGHISTLTQAQDT